MLERLLEPFYRLVDPAERIFWPSLVLSLVFPLVVMGARAGVAALQTGLLNGRLWSDPSARADMVLMLAKSLLFGVVRVPWLALTTSCALGLGLGLFRLFGPSPLERNNEWAVSLVFTLVLFIAWDASRFALHRLMHKSAVLWSFHQVHHSATVLTPLTLYRTHPIETLLYDLRGFAVTSLVTGMFLYLFPGRNQELQLLGVNAIGFVFNAAASNLRHSHVWLSFGRLERYVLSPAQHQVHHSAELHQQTSNFGTSLALWDRWCGTWAAATHQPKNYGLRRANHNPTNVTSMLVGPFLEMNRHRTDRSIWSRDAL